MITGWMLRKHHEKTIASKMFGFFGQLFRFRTQSVRKDYDGGFSLFLVRYRARREARERKF